MKNRLDRILLEKGLVSSRQEASGYILAGKVLVNGQKEDKPGKAFPIDCAIVLLGEKMPYVSRGGLKLQAAIQKFGIPISEQVCLDIGASTGGFTDCLLQKGAKKVYALDVGYGQLAWSLRQDPRVVCIEKTNFRYFERARIPEDIDLITIDVSFISLTKIIPAASQFLRPLGGVIALIKPQFEALPWENKKGVVKDPGIIQRVVEEMTQFVKACDYQIAGVVEAPITGPKGNQEYLLYALKQERRF